MMFIVTIYQGRGIAWFATVEAADREGAIHAAMNLMQEGGGCFTNNRRARGPLTVDVDARERTP